MKTQLLMALFICAISSSMYAQTPDSSFGINGNAVAISSAYEPFIRIQGSYIQPQGRILIGANLYDENGYERTSEITAFTAEGRLDSSFGNAGSVSLYGSESGGFISKQSDNKIVAAGIRSFSSTDILLTVVVERFTEDGQKDSSFGTDGKTVLPYNFELNQLVNCIAVDSSDYIYVGGSFQYSYNGQKYVTILRFTPNGVLDTSFHVRHFSGYNEVCSSLQIAPDGSMIAGYLYNNYKSTGLIKYTQDGKIDLSFGKNGGVQFGTSISSNYLLQVKKLKDGSILSSAGNNGHISFYKVLASGRFDKRFGNNGVIETGEPVGYFGNHIFDVDSKNRILLPSYDYRLKRYLANGGIDSSFGTDGDFTSPLNNFDSSAGGSYEMAIVSGNSLFGIGDYTDFNYVRYVVSKFKYVCDAQPALASKSATAIPSAVAQSKAAIVYPNPVYNQLSVAHLMSKTSLSIINAVGSVLSRVETTQATYRFDVSSLPRGMYYILVNDGKQTISFVKE